MRRAGAAPRVLVIGAGSLGTIYGACLARAGLPVTLLAREAHARAVSDQGGVQVIEGTGSWRVALRAEWRPERLEPHELVILLTKAHDSCAALAELDHIRDEVELAVSLQNGVEKDGVLSRWYGRERVIGGMSMVGATLERPGQVRWTLPGATFVGELPAGESERSRRLVQRLAAGGMKAVLCSSMLAAEWAKLVHAAPVMALTARSGLPLHEVLLDPVLARHYVRAVREGVAVATAAGVDLEDFPGLFPVRSLADATAEQALALVTERGHQLAGAGSTRVRVSMLIDLERGRPLELGTVHGFLVAEADRLGVEVPTIRKDLATLVRMTRPQATPT